MKILIHTVSDDIHAYAVKWALKKMNSETDIWLTDGFPSTSEASIHVDRNKNVSVGLHATKDIIIAEYDAIWNRRISQPIIRDDVHEADVKFALREANEFTQSIFLMENSSAFQVNPGRARRIANLKPIQLIEASKIGLAIPDTLISNSPSLVANFFKKHNGQVIFKSFTPHGWVTEEGEVANLTASFEEKNLVDVSSITITPGIYQEKIEKAHEYRITIMGKCAFTAVNHSFNSDLIDGRTNSVSSDGTNLVSAGILEKCYLLMQKLGICFGCFDFVQSKDQNEPIFLEVNEMGQWLSYERVIPSFGMLETFSNFLLSRDPMFDEKSPGELINYADFINSDLHKYEQKGILSRIRARNMSDNCITSEIVKK